ISSLVGVAERLAEGGDALGERDQLSMLNLVILRPEVARRSRGGAAFGSHGREGSNLPARSRPTRRGAIPLAEDAACGPIFQIRLEIPVRHENRRGVQGGAQGQRSDDSGNAP